MLPLETKFYQGRYKEVLEQTLDSATGTWPPVGFPYVVGSLAFTGRLQEAETLIRLYNEKITLEQQTEVFFYIGINFCRMGNFASAKRYLGLNLKARRAKCPVKTQFFIFQGLAFYRYIGGRFKLTLKWARLAQSCAIAGRFAFGKLLVLDLIGHSEVQLGQIAQGLKTLQLAIEMAERLNCDKLAQTFQISYISYQAQFRQAPPAAIESLQRAIADLTPDNVYSKASLLLELANQNVLRGRLVDATRALDSASELIYGSRHRRYDALLSLRYAFISHLGGQSQLALQLINSSRLDLNPKMDLVLESMACGLELKILSELGGREELRILELSDRLRVLSIKTGHSQTKHALNRLMSVERRHPSAADKVGQLIAQLSKGSTESLRILANEGVLQWAPYVLEIKPSLKGLVFDALPDSIFVFDRGNVDWIPRGFTTVLRAMAVSLSTGKKSNHELFKDIWGHEFDPLRHSQLLYQTVSRLRQLLGPFPDWITHDELGYAFSREIELLFFAAPNKKSESGQRSVPECAKKILFGDPMDLNWRQLEILKFLRREKLQIDVRWCTVQFTISEMTARRDLVDLVARGSLLRSGKARATKYYLTDDK